jgi:hypothetical protein
MSEQSLTSFEQNIPKFVEIDNADWGTSRNVEPTQAPGEQTDAGNGATDVGSGGPEVDPGRDLAIQRGWVPEEQWKGPKERWVDSGSFNERWEQVLPVVQKENKKLNEALKQANARIDELTRRSEGFTKNAQEQEATQRIVRVETLKMERKAALENGDTDALMRIDNDLLDLKVDERLQARTQPQAPAVDPSAVRILQEFSDDNPILSSDRDMQSAVAEQVWVMRQSQTPLRGRELLDKAMERVQRMYPEKFQRNGNAEPIRRHPIGETGFSPTGQRASPKRTWNDLKPEARAALDKFVATTPGATREGILASAGPEYFRS